MVSVVITHQLIILLVNEIVGLYDSFEKGMIITFFCLTGLLCNNHTKCYFNPRVCYFGSLNGNALIRNISTRSPISITLLVNGLGLCSSFMWIIIINSTFNHYISKRHIRIFDKRKLLLNESFFFGEIQYMNEKGNILRSASPPALSVQNCYRSRLIEQLDHWGYYVISLGFIFLTIGILSGAVWANEAWGSYWNWDPKETWAFITWTIFAIYLHIRTNKNLQSTDFVIVAFIGFLII
ncbi:LOW QUALITY PROTEIN: hypothetical protein Cgig2_030336 [Carnegiea gigantea]|uniref:Cytochrome c assembly protein domain-containing protein n=1 Tax=Carnegiea gigantea TaxID=171969 RepID=A0A9Q1JME5_9CARY|nr:LOW QUALITY PROTEIN: hypothetical protein Cgig2_030336 [Carnegiea gigantea]